MALYSIVSNSINKSFGNKRVLENISLTVSKGRIHGLLGPSGCGKTTTVKIIAGILTPSSGKTFILGKEMPDISLLSHIGYMTQSDALYPALTALENLRFFGNLYGLTKNDLTQRIDYVISLVDLKESLYESVSNFSGGMKRRLSLAICLLHRPDVLLLDEPTVGIDPILRENIWKELNKLAISGMTVLITTHVMDEAEKCHSLSMMRKGRIIASGSPDEIKKQAGTDTLEQAFIHFGKEAAQ